MPRPEHQRCNTCAYYKPIDEQEKERGGVCRRYPPTVYGKLHQRWPRMNHDAWCGEWTYAHAEPPTGDGLAARLDRIDEMLAQR